MGEGLQRAAAAACKTQRCDICGHALSIHNDLGYCRARSVSRGDCVCDRTGTSRFATPPPDSSVHATSGDAGAHDATRDEVGPE